MLDLNSGTPWETVMLTTLSRDRDLFPGLLAEARVLAQAAQVGRTVIYTAWGAEWKPFGRPRMRRLLDSVVLDAGVKERIVEDVQSFMKRGKWYFERGRSRLRFDLGPLLTVTSPQGSPIAVATSCTAHRARASHPSSKRSPVHSSTTFAC